MMLAGSNVRFIDEASGGVGSATNHLPKEEDELFDRQRYGIRRFFLWWEIKGILGWQEDKFIEQ